MKWHIHIFTSKNTKKTVECCDKVIKADSDYLENAFLLKGNILDITGDKDKAVKTYEEGILKFPNSHLMLYNLALTDYKLKKYIESEDLLIRALKLKPAHPGSHLILGFIMYDKSKKVKSILALSNFLLLEPTGKRAESAYALLMKLYSMGVTKENDNINITLVVPDDKDDFTGIDLMFQVNEAANLIDKNNNSEIEKFYIKNNNFYTMLEEIRNKDKDKGFWWEHYIDFYCSMMQSGNIEAFIYFISQSKNDKEILKWLKNNKGKLEKLNNWFAEYKRN